MENNIEKEIRDLYLYLNKEYNLNIDIDLFEKIIKIIKENDKISIDIKNDNSLLDKVKYEKIVNFFKILKFLNSSKDNFHGSRVSLLISQIGKEIIFCDKLEIKIDGEIIIDELLLFICKEIEKIVTYSNLEIKISKKENIYRKNQIGQIEISGILPEITIYVNEDYSLMLQCDDNFISFLGKEDKKIYKNLDKFCWSFKDKIILEKDQYLYSNGILTSGK